nr:MAG TPA: hypothetical protein [Caudoviricetes sp.]
MAVIIQLKLMRNLKQTINKQNYIIFQLVSIGILTLQQ